MTTNFPPGAPNWIDLGTTDVAGATAFYGALFGWTFQDMGPDAGGYQMIMKNGKQVAGLGPASDQARGTSWSVYFKSTDADDTAAKVGANQGKVIVAPMDVMDQGRMGVFADPAGAFFSCWQESKHHGSEVVDEHGTLTWAELMSPDIAAAKAFYEKVFPVSTRDVPIGNGMTYTLLESNGKSVAGAMQISPDMGPIPPHWSVYFAVDDCDATADKAVGLGASEIARADSPAGRFAILTDPQGGNFSMIKNDPNFAM
ncbi:MAG: VOC family protein [Actinocatenispora sp.]